MYGFGEISIIIAIATALAMVLHQLKQPLIIAYILAGFVAGPFVFDIIQSPETLALFSKIGIAILLFIIGLHLNPKIIKEVGGVSLITGIGQIVFTSIIGTGISILLGFPLTESIFIGLALTFSSTIIILKLLQDKGDLDKLYGKISVGFLLVQDIAASVILLSVSVLSQPDTMNLETYLGILGLRIIALAISLYAISRYVLPYLVRQAAKSQETLFLFCLSWGFIISVIFVSIGLSVEIGALVAGVTLSTTAFAAEISSRLRPLRDFFIVLFFISLGSEIVLTDIHQIVLPAILLSVFVLIGNPLIVFYLMNVLGHHKRTSFLSGLTVAQISEFSLILITLGYASGFVSNQAVALVTFVGLITIALSSYLIIYANVVYNWLSPVLSFISIRSQPRKIKKDQLSTPDIILFGYGRVGTDYIRTFEKLEAKYTIVDFDPNVISSLQERDFDAIYGDAEDIEFLEDLPLDKAKIIISTISDFETDQLITRQTRKVNENAIIVVKSNNMQDAYELYEKGATYVVMPYYLGGRYAAKMIKRLGLKESHYRKAQKEHIKFLKNRLAL